MAKSTDPKKQPVQQRSRTTVDALLEATARVVAEVGLERATTNRIAQVAGVSVGSLYQYFPSKEALLAGVLERESERTLQVMTEAIEKSRAMSLPDAVETMVRTLVGLYAARSKLYKQMLEQIAIASRERVREIEIQGAMQARRFLEERRHEVRPTDLDLATLIIAASVHAVVDAAILARPEAMEDETLVREICVLVLRYLTTG